MSFRCSVLVISIISFFLLYKRDRFERSLHWTDKTILIPAEDDNVNMHSRTHFYLQNKETVGYFSRVASLLRNLNFQDIISKEMDESVLRHFSVNTTFRRSDSVAERKYRYEQGIDDNLPQMNTLDPAPIKKVYDKIHSRLYYSWTEKDKFSKLVFSDFFYLENFCFDPPSGNLTFYEVNPLNKRSFILPSGLSRLTHSKRHPMTVRHSANRMKSDQAIINNVYMIMYNRRQGGYGEYEWINSMFSIISIQELPPVDISHLLVYPALYNRKQIPSMRQRWERDYLKILLQQLTTNIPQILTPVDSITSTIRCFSQGYLYVPSLIQGSIFYTAEQALFMRSAIYKRYSVQTAIEQPSSVQVLFMLTHDHAVTIENKDQLMVVLAALHDTEITSTDLAKVLLGEVVKIMAKTDVMIAMQDQGFQNLFLLRPRSVVLLFSLADEEAMDWNELFDACEIRVVRRVISDERRSSVVAYINSLGSHANKKSIRINSQFFSRNVQAVINLAKGKYV